MLPEQSAHAPRMMISSLMHKSKFLAGIVARSFGLILLALMLTSCDTTIGIKFVHDNNDTPTFKVTGDEPVSWIWVHGPYPKDPVAEKPPLIWKINPVRSNPLPSDLPPIVYGKVPTGWEQEVPKEAVPLLIDGALYGITVVTTRNRSAGLVFLVQNGKAEEYKGKLWWKDNPAPQ